MLTMLITSSCELPTVIQADKYIEPAPVDITETIPLYETVWDRIKDGVQSDHTNLDKKTLGYINAYLANPDQVNKLLEKGRYFIFLFLKN